jgi:membrane associated rhomboid family serine protease
VLPYRDDAPRPRLAAGVLLLGLLNLTAFARLQGLAKLEMLALAHTYGLVPARFSEGIGHLSPDDTLPFLSHAFLHAGWPHLLVNLWALWLLGPALERRAGLGGVLALYAAGAVVGGLTRLAAHPDSPLALLGASGAVSGLLGAYLVAFPRANLVCLAPLPRQGWRYRIPVRVVVMGWLLAQAVGLAHGLWTSAAAIAWEAHLGAFLAGLLAGLAVRRVDPAP